MTIAARIAAVVMAALQVAGECPADVPRPNIILVMCDDLGWADLQAFDPAARSLTPQLSAMAAAGMRFDRFYAAAPVCSPTRGSCLTGRHPSRYGIPTANAGHMPAGEVLLPELLRDAGYATGHFGKWHLGTLTVTLNDSNRGREGDHTHFSPPWHHGYQRVFATEAKVPTFDPLWRPSRHDGKAWDPVPDRSVAESYGTRYWNERGVEVTGNLDGDDSRAIMDRALPFMRAAAASRTPFFATLWFHAPHLPVVAGPPFTDPYKDDGVYERNYFGCIAALDAQVGRLRQTLDELGIARDTMLWFCSDNGPEGKAGSAPGSAGPFRGRKRSLYEGGVRVPGILEWPATVKAGTVTRHAAVTSDFLPTILDALALKMPDGRPLDGTSLMPVLRGDPDFERAQPIGFHFGKQAALHAGSWKIHSGDNGTTWQLFDLDNDPGETRDLSSDAPGRAGRLIDHYRAWRSSCQRSSRGADYASASNR